MANSTKEQYFGDFDTKIARRVKVAKRELKEKLDVDVAVAENKLGLRHTPTSPHGEKVYHSAKPERDRPLAKAMINHKVNLANDFISGDWKQALDDVSVGAEAGYAAQIRSKDKTSKITDDVLIGAEFEQPDRYPAPSGDHTRRLIARQIVDDFAPDDKGDLSR